jgi:Lon protease-like protein
MRADLQIADLPSTVYLFSLDRFILLPETTLPLVVTHPRSQEILDAAEAAGGFVGVIQSQPKDAGGPSRFFPVGGLGRIASLRREEDGHHVILEGVIRFRLREELAAAGDLPQATVAYRGFEADLLPADEEVEGWNQEGFRTALLEIAKRQSGRDKTPLESLSPAQLVRLLAQTVPFSAAEKQALLEAKSFGELLGLLLQLLALNFLTTTPDNTPSRAN